MNKIYIRVFFSFILLQLISCGNDDDNSEGEIITETPFILKKLRTIDETGIENVYLYEYDENEKLVSVTQFNPLNGSELNNVYSLIYDIEENLISINYKIGTTQVNDFPVNKGSNLISITGFGANNLNYSFDSNSLITKKEWVFDSNTNQINYLYNSSNQLQEMTFILAGESSVADTFSNYDENEPFLFISPIVNPVEDYIISYVFKLNYSLSGKPQNNSIGEIIYIMNNSNSISEVSFSSGAKIILE